MTAPQKLKNPPISEIVFTISFNENVPLEKIESFSANKNIKALFPTVNRGMSANITARLASAQTTTTTTTATDNIILRSEPASKVIQAKIGSFAFHKINGYQPFDTLLMELNQHWSLFVDITELQLTINSISLRYVNFIKRDEGEDVNDLFEVKSQHPFGKLDSFLSHYKFPYNKETTANVVFAIAKQKNQNGVVFDIMLNKKLSPTTQGLEAFADMRDAKNDIFFRCITERTKQKYDR